MTDARNVCKMGLPPVHRTVAGTSSTSKCTRSILWCERLSARRSRHWGALVKSLCWVITPVRLLSIYVKPGNVEFGRLRTIAQILLHCYFDRKGGRRGGFCFQTLGCEFRRCKRVRFSPKEERNGQHLYPFTAL